MLSSKPSIPADFVLALWHRQVRYVTISASYILNSVFHKLAEQGVGFVSQKENIDTTTPTGKFILTVFGAIAELEREYILQRQAEGIAIAKANGVYKGRKPLDCPDFDKVYQQVKLGKISATEAFRQLNVSKSTYYRRVRERQRSAGNQASE